MRLIWFTLIFFAGSLLVNAQYRKPQQQSSKSDFSDRIYFGGGGGINGGTDFFTLTVSPMVGYKFTDRFSAGLIATYQYSRIFNIRYNAIGGGPFARFNVTPKLFFYTEYEYLSFGARGEDVRFNFESLFAGLGYIEPIGDRVAFQVVGLYNLLYGTGENSPYGSPIIFRIGLVANFF